MFLLSTQLADVCSCHMPHSPTRPVNMLFLVLAFLCSCEGNNVPVNAMRRDLGGRDYSVQAALMCYELSEEIIRRGVPPAAAPTAQQSTHKAQVQVH
jgi:hypothetical protein